MDRLHAIRVFEDACNGAWPALRVASNGKTNPFYRSCALATARKHFAHAALIFRMADALHFHDDLSHVITNSVELIDEVLHTKVVDSYFALAILHDLGEAGYSHDALTYASMN